MVYDPAMSVLISSQVIPPDGRPSEEGYKNPLLSLPNPPSFFFLFYLSISQFLLRSNRPAPLSADLVVHT